MFNNFAMAFGFRTVLEGSFQDNLIFSEQGLPFEELENFIILVRL
jgi:hypothetical protein